MKGIKSKSMMMVCLTVFAASAYGQKVEQPATKALDAAEHDAHTHENSTGAGQMVFIDPKTGEIVPGQGQADATASKKLEPLSVLGSGVASAPQLLEDGSMKIELNGQFIVPISVSIDKDGNMQKGHHIQVESESDKESN